jgi:Predicted membrane protein
MDCKASKLIACPLGLLAVAVILDLITLWSGNPKWTGMAFWMIAAGVLSGVIGVAFEFIDWAAIPAGTRENCTGMYHGAGNIVVVGCFAASWILRRPAPDQPETIAYVFSFLGAGVAAL